MSRDNPSNSNISINIIRIKSIYLTSLKALFIETIINLIDFNFLKIFASLTTRKILRTLRKDNLEVTDLLAPTTSMSLLLGVTISTTAKIIIRVSK